jgi:hypothetical protein
MGTGGAADKGDWKGFVMLMGGPEAKRKDFPISLAKQSTDELNRCREPKGNAVIGVIWERVVFPIRVHQWTIQPKCEPNKLKKPVGLKEPSKRSSAIITLHQIGSAPLKSRQ